MTNFDIYHDDERLEMSNYYHFDINRDNLCQETSKNNKI